MIPVLTECTGECVVCGDIACERDLLYVETQVEADNLDAAIGDCVCRDCAEVAS